MAVGGQYAFAIGEILDKLERCVKEVARSIDSRNRVDIERLGKVRDILDQAMGAIDELMGAARPERQ